jgi:glycosyltransferase involved in cell wall biosynthesis
MSSVLEEAPARPFPAAPLRVLVLTNAWPSHSAPGFGVFVEQQVLSLQRRSIDVEVVARSSRSLLDYPRFFARGASRLGKRDHDVVHAHYGFHSALPALLGNGPPLVTTFHRGDALDEPRRNAVYARLQRWCVHRSVALIAVSREIRDELVSGLAADPERIHIVPCGVDTDRFQPPQSPAAGAGGPATIVWSGSPGSSARKGLDIVLDLARRMPDARFQLIGIPGTASLPENCQALGRVDNALLPRVLQCADLFLAPTRSEGTPVAVLEAMACAVPVLASPVGGIPDVLKDGANGFLLSSLESGAVLNHVSRVLATPRFALREVAANGARTVREHFSLEVISRKIESVLRWATSEQAPPQR